MSIGGAAIDVIASIMVAVECLRQLNRCDRIESDLRFILPAEIDAIASFIALRREAFDQNSA